MKEILREWVKSKKPQMILKHKTVVSLITYEVWEWIGNDDNFYSINVLYTPTKLLGTLESLKTKSLVGNVSDSVERDVYYEFEGMMKSFKGREDWIVGRSPILTKKEIDSYLSEVVQEVLNEVSSVEYGRFRVVSVTADLSKFVHLIVGYVGGDKMEVPLKISVGEPSLIKKKKDSEFVEFVELLTELTGGVVWY